MQMRSAKRGMCTQKEELENVCLRHGQEAATLDDTLHVDDCRPGQESAQ